MHDGIVEIGVEFHGFHLGDVQLAQGICRRLERHPDALGDRVILLFRGYIRHGTLQRVHDGQQLPDSVRAGVGVNAFLFLCGAAPEIVVLCQHPQVFVPLGCEFLLCLLQFLVCLCQFRLGTLEAPPLGTA